jgi:hypothetical protein
VLHDSETGTLRKRSGMGRGRLRCGRKGVSEADELRKTNMKVLDKERVKDASRT